MSTPSFQKLYKEKKELQKRIAEIDKQIHTLAKKADQGGRSEKIRSISKLGPVRTTK